MSQIEHAAAFVAQSTHGSTDVPAIQKIVFESIAGIRDHLKSKYGSMVVACCDSRNTWRKAIFSPYKAQRQVARVESGIDWRTAYAAFRAIESAMNICTDVVVVSADGAEGDDCIAVIADRNKNDDSAGLGGLSIGATAEPTVVVSSDKDYGQIDNIDRWCPRTHVFLNDDHATALARLIVGGDRADGIPNVISDDDALVNPAKKQIVMTAKRRGVLEAMYLHGDTEDCVSGCSALLVKGEPVTTHWKRNAQLIDFKYIPLDIQAGVIRSFEASKIKDRKGLFSYLVEHRMTHLVEPAQRLLT